MFFPKQRQRDELFMKEFNTLSKHDQTDLYREIHELGYNIKFKLK